MRYTVIAYSAAERLTRCSAAEAFEAGELALDRLLDVGRGERLVAVLEGDYAAGDIVEIQHAAAWALGAFGAATADDGADPLAHMDGVEPWTVVGWWIDALETAVITLWARSGEQAIASVIAAASAGDPGLGAGVPLRVAAAVRGPVVPVLTIENLPL